METYYKPTSSFWSYLKNFNLFLFFSLQIMFIEACQFHMSEQDIMFSDEIRNIHAQQLLQSKEAGVAKEFNGDPLFTRYISSYVSDHNSSIDVNNFTNSLLTISRTHSYDPVFLLAVIQTESKFDQNAIGSVGEVGLMQIKPDTAEWICQKNNIIWRGANALKEPEYNMLIGSYYFQYLKAALDTKSSKSPEYVTAYNMGLKGLLRARGEKPIENDYLDRVIANYINIYSELKKIRNRLNTSA
ncbi:MAG: transglycosylase SLT domain-containing protein [Pseudobdellovibrio sp.]